MNENVMTVKESDLNFAMSVLNQVRNGASVVGDNGKVVSPSIVFENDEVQKNLKVRIKGVLNILGIRTNIKGYMYLVSAIQMTYNDPLAAQAVTKELYPTVAKEFNTTASRVERAIRHAIEVGVDSGATIDEYQRIFGNSISYNKGKPTNSHFVTTIADYLHNQD